MVSLKIKQLPTAVRSTSSKRRLFGPFWEKGAVEGRRQFPRNTCCGPALHHLPCTSLVFIAGVCLSPGNQFVNL